MRIMRTMCALAIVGLAALPALAQEYGSPAEAKAMIEKVVTAMKANKAQTLQDITAGKYKEKDLYPFCGGTDGNFTAHGGNASLVGQSMKDRKDPTGKVYGADFYKDAQVGKFAEVSYMYARPSETNTVPKVAYVTKIDDQVCGVGYYKQ